MKKLLATIALVMVCFWVTAQKTKKTTESGWSRLMKKFKDPATIIANYQSMIDLGKSRNNHRMVIYYQLLLGDNYEKMDDYAMAESMFTQAYQEAKKNLPSKHQKFYLQKRQNQRTIFDAVDQLGYFYLTIGNLKRAAELFQESKQLRDNFFPVHSIHRVHPIVGMGSYYLKKGQFDKTYAQFSLAQKMMARATTTGYDFDNVNRLFLSDMVELCLILNKEQEALKYLNRLAVASSGFGKFSSLVGSRHEIAKVFELKSRYYLTFGNFKKAQQYLDKANHYNPVGVTISTIKLKLLKTEALLNWYQGKLEISAKAFQNLAKEYRNNIKANFTAMSDYEREQFYITLKNDFDLFNSFVTTNPGQSSDELVGEMYNNILNTKALLLNETNRKKNQILLSGNSELIGKLGQWENAKNQLAALYFEKNTPEQIEALEKTIETLERDINQASGIFLKKDKEISWQDVKSNLKDGEAALEIVRVNSFNKTNPQRSAIRNGLTDSTVYAVLMVTNASSQPECFQLPVGNRLENRYLPYYRNSILLKTEDKLSYDAFWRPIKNHLSGVKKVYLSADGVYNQLNLNTLKNRIADDYLIDEIELISLTNTADLLATPSVKNDRRAFLIGRPAFEFSKTQISTALSTPSSSLARGMRSLTKEELGSFKEQNFSDLPGTAEEVSLIGSVLGEQNIQVISYIGTNALEDNVKAIKRPELLHIATHGFFIDDTASSINPLIRSGIILAGVRNTEENKKEDGVLTAYEATSLDLEGTDLVVLSACETGLGEVRNGEGVYGLQRSIIVAGSKNLLMSLWKVDDEATAKLMSAFYKLRSNRNNITAFREAEIELRKTYPDPYYWGAFVMLGK